VGAADDATAVYWNPANLTQLKTGHFSMMHAETLDSSQYNTMSIGFPIPRWGGVGGLSIQSAVPPNINATNETGVSLGTLKPHDTNVALAWGHPLGDSWSLGGGMEFVNSKIVHTARAFSLDLGGSYKWSSWRFGMALRHALATQLKYDSEKNPLPRALVLGGAYRLKDRWLFSMDTNSTRGSNVVWGLGGEYRTPVTTTQDVFLRAGYQTRPNDLPGTQGISLGLGWRWNDYSIDYAFLPMGSVNSPQTHRISLGARFGVPRVERVEPPPPLDTDKDGVLDGLDQCADTPLGVSVDEKGCPQDEDKDGVFDEKDRCPGTPSATPVDKWGCPTIIEPPVYPHKPEICPASSLGEVAHDNNGCFVVIHPNVLFSSDSTQVKKDLAPHLAVVGKFLQEHAAYKVEIQGNADSTGPEDYNQRLSLYRALSLRMILVDEYGVDPARITAVAYGEDRPIASNSTAAGRRANRRVTLLLRDALNP
jgi:OOP family OmpA-OmpF porin